MTDKKSMHSHPESDAIPLRQQLESLLHHARLNEEKMQRFDRLERRLIASGSLLELLHIVLDEYTQEFGLEFISLYLFDPEAETTRYLNNEQASDAIRQKLTLLASAGPLEALHGSSHTPWLGPFSTGLHGALFPASADNIASVALLPLVRKGELMGSLHLGSSNPERYTADCGTQLLERLSGIIAVCLDNALNQERLKQVGLIDGLTGVQNRRYFEHRCQVEISQSHRYKHALACMFLDIDKFKRINDTYGHQTGDAVLRTAAGIIQSQLRAGDTVARYGGEEFVVLLPQATSHHAREVAERIRARIAETHFEACSGHEINVTISIGLAMLPTAPAPDERQHLAERMVANADKALYRAKQSGRNRVVLDTSELPPTPRSEMITTLWQTTFPKLAQLIGMLPAMGSLALKKPRSR